MRLLPITPGDGRDLRPWLEALDGAGVREVLLREKQLQNELRTDQLVRDLQDVLVHRRPHGVPNHPVTLRVHADCPGGRRVAQRWGLPIHLSAGKRVPHAFGWSTSCHAPEEVEEALAAGADFCLYSPVFPPTSKPEDTRRTLGVEGFLAVGRHRAVFALGGITPARAARLKGGGCTGVAVLGDLFGQPTPEDAAARVRAYSQL